MKTFQSYLKESFTNYIDKGLNSDQRTPKLAKDILDVLQFSYKDIGGIKGSGFNSAEDMIANVPFWKIDRHPDTGKISSVVLYKDKGGRKSVAIGGDGSKRGKDKIMDVFRSELGRSYSEKSKSALGLLIKVLGDNNIKSFLIKPENAKTILNKEVTPISNMDDRELPRDAQMTLSKYPWIKDYGYLRDIGGTQTFKVLLGTTNINIK